MRVAKTAIGLTIFIGSFSAALTGYGDFLGEIRVFVQDSSSGCNGGAPPPQTTAIVNGSTPYSFGTNNVAVFSGYYETGAQLVEISLETTGYLLRQHSAETTNSYSTSGTSRYVDLSEENYVALISFVFDPILTISAIVRDAWTMERIEDATVEFIGKTGANSGVVYSKFPWATDYTEPWVTGDDGSFPTNTVLYFDAYDLGITKGGYNSLAAVGIITNAAVGDSLDLGTLFLEPIDLNGNQIGDTWESAYFGSGQTVIGEMDEDGDGASNYAEYLAGTDPTNQTSCLRLAVESSGTGLVLSWNTEPNRTYCVSGTTNLLSDTWVQVAGPWEANDGSTEMEWLETNTDLSWNSNYRIEIVPCYWQGVNEVLINTNRPAGFSGSGTYPEWSGTYPPAPNID
ncbi:MAG: hypothetical protein JXR40_08275 [Pontiellaceae bacterium]|nr:hypothetical protein [Pontiellaceae bacterium]